MSSVINQKVKQLMPMRLLYYYYLVTAHKAAHYDLRRRIYDKVYNRNDGAKVKRDLTLLYHIVEKGLTMPEPRPRFGKKVVIELCSVVRHYRAMHLPEDALEFVQAVSSLREYFAFHREVGVELEEDVGALVEQVLKLYPEVRGEAQIDITSDAYFEHRNAPFDVFCRSRFSVRNYTAKSIPLEELYECVDLAQKSPSFCNRQPTRVHIVKSPGKKEAVLALQNGNRGFGHLAETLIVLTSDIATTKDIHERYENHLNGGMFAMTLLNALHFKKIAACSLNWSASDEQDMALRSLLNIPVNEVVLLIISCGYPPAAFRMAASPRFRAPEITIVHQ